MNVAIAAIVTQNNHILLLRRVDTDTWAFPGGKLDQELVTDGVLRELKEETGIIGLAPRYVCYTDDILNNMPYVTLYFDIATFTGIPTVQEPHKHIAIGWFHLHALPVLYEPTKAALDKLYNAWCM